MKLPFGMTERGVSGAGIFILTVIVLVALIVNPSLGDSDLFKTLAQAIVVQGLIGLCMAYWFTASKATTDTPQQVEVVNPPEQPVPTDPQQAKGE